MASKETLESAHCDTPRARLGDGAESVARAVWHYQPERSDLRSRCAGSVLDACNVR